MYELHQVPTKWGLELRLVNSIGQVVTGWTLLSNSIRDKIAEIWYNNQILKVAVKC